MKPKRLGLVLRTQSPVLLADGPPAGNLTETLDFIPGNTLRGLLAYRFLEQGRTVKDSLFRRLFVSGEASFGCSRIDGARAIPLSARSCKYQSGFRADSGHGVRDLLLDDADTVHSCRECGQPMDYFSGHMDGRPASRGVAKRLINRTAVDPLRGTARHGMLYSQRVIEEGQSFHATVEFPQTLRKPLERLLSAGSFTARIGTGASRGQGWVEVERHTLPTEVKGTASERYRRYPKKNGRPVLALTLLSDALFTDDYLRDRGHPRAQDLVQLGLEPEDWEDRPYRVYSATRQVFGFDGVPLNLPRTPRLAVAAGSAFLFVATTDQPKIADGTGIGWIGDNRLEGYGRAVLWDSFHVEPEANHD